MTRNIFIYSEFRELRSAALAMIPLLALASVSVAQARHGFYQTPSRFAYPDQAPILWKDQADSGMTTATISGNGANHFGQPNAIAFARMMSMMLDSGVIDPDFPILALSMGARPCYDAQLQAQRPWPELIIGNVDEPNPTRKAEVEAEHKEAHRMGFRSGTAIAGYNVEPLAEFLDVWIVSARTWMPNLKELAKEHDADLWAYWAQESTGDPERCRYFFGLWTWARQIECSMVWAYTHESGTKVQPNGTRVSEKSDKFSYAIPTAFGKPLHTPGYEGLIDGIKDCRALEAAERNGGPECQKWLAKLRKSVPLRVPNPGKPLPDFNLDKIRKQALKWSQARVDRSASKKPAPAASKKESK